MRNEIIYTGTYTDPFGSTEIRICNDFQILSCTIDGVLFEGGEFSGLTIIEKENYSTEQLKRFSFLKTQIYNSDRFIETLCNCSFNITIPQIIIDKAKQKDREIDLQIEYSLGNARPNLNAGIEHETMKLSLVIDYKTYTSVGDYMEVALDQLKNQFNNQYHFKNCYGCMYGDYSVYGQSAFGTMCCLVKQKDVYLTVKTKQDYLKLSMDVDTVQEIYLCNNYEIRKPNTGYRG
jgi:hypothetical protein